MAFSNVSFTWGVTPTETTVACSFSSSASGNVSFFLFICVPSVISTAILLFPGLWPAIVDVKLSLAFSKPQAMLVLPLSYTIPLTAVHMSSLFVYFLKSNISSQSLSKMMRAICVFLGLTSKACESWQTKSVTLGHRSALMLPDWSTMNIRSTWAVLQSCVSGSDWATSVTINVTGQS